VGNQLITNSRSRSQKNEESADITLIVQDNWVKYLRFQQVVCKDEVLEKPNDDIDKQREVFTQVFLVLYINILLPIKNS